MLGRRSVFQGGVQPHLARGGSQSSFLSLLPLLSPWWYYGQGWKRWLKDSFSGAWNVGLNKALGQGSADLTGIL